MAVSIVARPDAHRVSGFAWPWRRMLTVLAIVIVAVGGWLTLAPTALGGPASYVITDGTSMLPKFHANGLVVTRSEDSYHVGEVLAYHNGQLHQVVMHRIVAMDGDRYVFKGDNNDFRDSYHAKRSDLVGKEWLYWPGGGAWMRVLQNPLTFAVILALVAFLAFRSPRRNRHRRHAHH